MVKETAEYPIFRKYPNDKSFFKIIHKDHFIEIQVMGKRYFKHALHANKLPDFHLIEDMINMHNGHWVESNEDEFNKVYNLSKNQAFR